MLSKNPHLYKYFNEANQRTGRQAGAFSSFLSGDQNKGGGEKCLKGTPGVHDGLSASCPSAQSKTLADAVIAYATNIEQLENLSEAVERICHKHCALGITPEDYIHVHDNFLEAVGEVLGEAVTADVAAAWSEALMALAKIFIQTEEGLYNQAKEKQWVGVQEFIISKIIDEATDVKSFRFTPKEDGVMKKNGFTPGQYITIFEKPELKEYFAPRHYTVTSQPDDDFLQVTVKRLVDPIDPTNKDHNGFYSNYLHSRKEGDVIHCGAVYGPDLLAAGDTSRVVAFVSVGIGITPTKAMLPYAIKTRPSVAVFHGNSDPDHQAFKGDLEDEVKKSGGLWAAYYSHIEGGERLSGDKMGGKLKDAGIDPKKVDFFICAGNATMKLYDQLINLGINKNCIHMEYFGPFQMPPGRIERSIYGVESMGELKVNFVKVIDQCPA